MSAELRIEDCRLSFAEWELRVDAWTISAGECAALTGPSGSGKSSFLRWITGLPLAGPASGRILSLRDGAVRELSALPPERRELGVVFQDPLLFPHLTLAENIAFPLKLRHWKKDRTLARVGELLAAFGLGHRSQAYPVELSGGERSRGALARALASDPRALLLDEPFSALDPALRTELRQELRSRVKGLGIPVLLVTHDESDVALLADRAFEIVEERRLGARVERVVRSRA